MPTDPAALECWRLRVRGRVQGVGFRDACLGQARRLGLSGWVRNRTDTSVELLLQGPMPQLEGMSAWLRHGVPIARVDAVEIERVAEPFEPLDGFERRPTA